MSAFSDYGKSGSVYGHDLVILEHHEPDKRKRRMCRCGCRKKQTHIQYCNGVGMNGGCEKSINAMVDRINKQKAKKAKRQRQIDKIKERLNDT